VIVTLLPLNQSCSWLTPAAFKPELVPEELMAQSLSVSLLEISFHSTISLPYKCFLCFISIAYHSLQLENISINKLKSLHFIIASLKVCSMQVIVNTFNNNFIIHLTLMIKICVLMIMNRNFSENIYKIITKY
jgi:hypothetical protein